MFDGGKENTVRERLSFRSAETQPLEVLTPRQKECREICFLS